MADRTQLILRAAAAIFVAAGLLWAWNAFGAAVTGAYMVWRYPAVKAPAKLGEAMRRDVDGVRRAELTGQYKRIMEELDAAEAQGLLVGNLREKLPVAARMIRAGQFDYARVMLSSIEARVPRKREVLAPASAAPDPEDEEPAPRPKPAARKAPASKRRGR